MQPGGRLSESSFDPHLIGEWLKVGQVVKPCRTLGRNCLINLIAHASSSLVGTLVFNLVRNLAK